MIFRIFLGKTSWWGDFKATSKLKTLRATTFFQNYQLNSLHHKFFFNGRFENPH